MQVWAVLLVSLVTQLRHELWFSLRRSWPLTVLRESWLPDRRWLSMVPCLMSGGCLYSIPKAMHPVVWFIWSSMETMSAAPGLPFPTAPQASTHLYTRYHRIPKLEAMRSKWDSLVVTYGLILWVPAIQSIPSTILAQPLLQRSM